MMKRLRIAILAFFLVVAAVFTYTLVKRRATVDYYAPVIAFDEDVLQVSVSATDADLLAGVTARDNLDGDVTDSSLSRQGPSLRQRAGCTSTMPRSTATKTSAPPAAR